MAPRGKSVIVIAVAVVGALLFSALAAVGVVAMKRSADVHKADQAAAQFEREFSDFEQEVENRLRAEQFSEDPATLVSAANSALDDAPELVGVPSHGAANSQAYQQAQNRLESLEGPLNEVKTVAEEAQVAKAWAEEAREVLRLRVSDFTSQTVFRNGDVLRDDVVPKFESALEDFKEVEAPPGQDELVEQVTGAVEWVIDDIQRVARRLDGGSGGTVRYNRLLNADRAIIDYERDLRERIDAAISSVGSPGGGGGEATEPDEDAENEV